MSRITVHGLGAVSPAGWGMSALREALRTNESLPVTALGRPGWEKPLHVRPVPAAVQRLPFLSHPRLRRVSPITQYAVAAALEALGEDAAQVQSGSLRLRIILCLMPGCVTYSRRFYEEVLRDPATASPLLFPETVFNAPASHLAAFLNSADVSYSLVGDDTSFLQGLALAAAWLSDGQTEGCLVVGAEEMDWIVADAVRLFTHEVVQGAGAAALYLRAEGAPGPAIELSSVTDIFRCPSSRGCLTAPQAARAQLPPFDPGELLCLGTRGWLKGDAEEVEAWRDWTGHRLQPKRILGEAFTASAAWQCAAACDQIQQRAFQAANVSVVGASRQAAGARFVATM